MYAFLYTSDFLGVIESCMRIYKTIHNSHPSLIVQSKLQSIDLRDFEYRQVSYLDLSVQPL